MTRSHFLQPARAEYLFLLTLLLVSPAFAQYTNGIYAEFNTSMGSFTCRLDYAIAPKAVANFIGLATGEKPWLDLPSGQIKTNPFYNGLTFHRVIADFMNQGGSRNGLGTDGPGYQFVDEFTNTARFDGFGLLAMANSGPDSNGSQYFITVSPQAQLNDVHTIFGRLYGGSNVVYAINHVATDANDKPLTNVVLQSVVIQRIGSAAQAFDINAQGLPVVTNLSLGISKTGAVVTLSFSNRLDVENRFYNSTNLQSWSGGTLGFETALPLVNSLLTSATLPSAFFRGVQIQYPPSLYVPRSVMGRNLTLNFSGGSTFNVAFDNTGGGTYTVSGGGGGQVVFYGWRQDAYRGRLQSIWMPPNPLMDLHLAYSNTNSGNFKGTAYLSSTNSVPVSGTFSSSP